MRYYRNFFAVAAAVLMIGATSLAGETGGEPERGTGAEGEGMVLKFSLMRSALTMRIDASGLNDTIYYEPNIPNAVGVGISFGSFGLRFPSLGEYGADSEREYGKTESSDFQMYYYGTSFCIDFIHQNYKGFYLDYPEDFGYNPGDPQTIRRDIAVKTVGLNIYYLFSESLSLRSAFEQIGRQGSSGGSFMVMLGLQRQEISAGYSIIPASVATQVGVPYLGGKYYNGTLAFGYGYNFIRGKYYIAPVILFGLGATRVSDDLGDTTQRRYDMVTKTIGKLAAGYNGDSFFYGLSFVMDAVQYFAERSDEADSASSASIEGESRESIGVSVESGYIELFAGLRFD